MHFFGRGEKHALHFARVDALGPQRWLQQQRAQDLHGLPAHRAQVCRLLLSPAVGVNEAGYGVPDAACLLQLACQPGVLLLWR